MRVPSLLALIPFYQKCVVPTFPPDAGSQELSCCDAEKRQFPQLALQNALNYRTERFHGV